MSVQEMTDKQVTECAKSLAIEIDKLCARQEMGVVMLALAFVLAKGIQHAYCGRAEAVRHHRELLDLVLAKVIDVPGRGWM